MTDSKLAQALFAATDAEFRDAAAHIAADAVRTPLLPFPAGNGRSIRLKCENLQPLGSFKIRAGASAVAMFGEGPPAAVATASAGNFAQGLTLAARRRGMAVTVHAPETAARVKVAAMEALGARVVEHPFERWWEILSTRDTGADDGAFVHPVAERGVVLGNGTIGLELAEDWPDLDTLVVPFGGGGLVSGIALALRVLGVPARIIACEAETSTPLAAAFAAGHPVRVERKPSFVDGIGSNSVLEEMWPLLRELVDDVIVVSVAEIRTAVRALATQSHVVAEGAGAAALAAALSPTCGGHNVAAVISGGNIDAARLAEILSETEGGQATSPGRPT
ncbi:MAG TPA: pyridoxal-phosphate dependent enzyme [Woeseiaceae bacterium]|nr:pyridoxal-phosphate dependent enzyme [Woeseiaceae bacterium]